MCVINKQKREEVKINLKGKIHNMQTHTFTKTIFNKDCPKNSKLYLQNV